MMPSVLVPVECDEFEVKLIEVSPDASPLRELTGEVAFLCFDLETFGLHKLVEWIKAVREQKLEEPELIIPCFVAIGRLSQVWLSDALRVRQELRSVGAIYFEWPEDAPTFKAAIRKFGEELNKIYKQFYRDEEGSFLPKSVTPHHRQGEILPLPHDAESPDLSAYADPPIRLDDEDFQSLIRRMDLPDDSL